MTEILNGQNDFAMNIGQTTALIAQLLRRTPGAKLSQGDIADAIASVSDLYMAAATLELWKEGKVEFGWDSEESQLVLCSTEIDSENAGDGRLVLGERN
ncbi:hypothetical protein [Mycobacterium sp. C31M]